MSQSNLTRGLLLSTLVWTLSTNCTLKVSAQAIDNLSSSMAKQEQNITNDQDILQKIEILQQKAEQFRKTVDSLNIEIQEQFNSQRTSNIVDVQSVLVNWEQLNIIWRDFTKDLEQNPGFSNLLQEDRVFKSIDQNLIFQKNIISNLEKVLNNSSTLIVTEFQEQLFTRRELNRNSYPYGTFEEKTQHKFALISTNKARELELQVSQIENILSAHLLHRKEINNTNYEIVSKSQLNSTDTKELLDFNTFIALFLLSSCAIFIILRASKQNSSVLQAQDFPQDENSKTPRNNLINYNVADYLKNIQQVENQALKILNYSHQIIENKKHSIKTKEKSQIENYPVSSYNKKNKPNFNSSDLSTTEKFSTQISNQAVQELLPTVTSLITEEDLILLYRKNHQLLYQKSIEVEITKESLQGIKAGRKSHIILKKASNCGYWIVLEPKLENDCYFLVPNPTLDINSLNLQSIDKIFNCTRYNNRTSDQFNLKYSAMVQVHSSTSWRLIGTGEIIFS